VGRGANGACSKGKSRKIKERERAHKEDTVPALPNRLRKRPVCLCRHLPRLRMAMNCLKPAHLLYCGTTFSSCARTAMRVLS